jgi:NAD(P)-dependent dehydrogenase (short-subunit alcohol dehydrogenase family)
MADSFEHASFAGKVAVVTGAAQGIGEAVARLLAARGAAGLLLTDRNREQGEAVARSIAAAGTPVEFVAADLAVASEVETIVPAADRRFGRLDVLANCAGLTDRGTVWDTTPELWDKMFAVNVRAPFFLMQAALRIMVREASEGAIVNIVSVNAHRGAAHLTPYSASKGALATLTKNVAHSVAPYRIKVNGINLGWADTPGEHTTLKRFHRAAEGWLDDAEKNQPWGRLIKPDEVARTVAFLASAEAGLMTGTVFDFDQAVRGPREPIARVDQP